MPIRQARWYLAATARLLGASPAETGPISRGMWTEAATDTFGPETPLDVLRLLPDNRGACVYALARPGDGVLRLSTHYVVPLHFLRQTARLQQDAQVWARITQTELGSGRCDPGRAAGLQAQLSVLRRAVHVVGDALVLAGTERSSTSVPAENAGQLEVLAYQYSPRVGFEVEQGATPAAPIATAPVAQEPVGQLYRARQSVTGARERLELQVLGEGCTLVVVHRPMPAASFEPTSLRPGFNPGF